MPVKTYIPGAVNTAKTAHRYLTRYETQLKGNLSSAEEACLVDLIAALAAFLACVLKPNPEP